MEAQSFLEHERMSKHPVILVVSFDGFKSDYFNQVNTPTLQELKASGVSVPFMTPTFPTFTFPNHQSIATGLYTESHRVVANTFFDPKFNRTLNVMETAFWNYHPEVLPLWIRNEMAGDGRVSGCYMWPGSELPYGSNNDKLPTYFIQQYNQSVPWEERVNTVISWMTNDTAPANLAFLYFNEPDTHGHEFGPNDKKTLHEVSNTDKRVKYLVDQLKEQEIFDNVNLIVLSDHGMESVTLKKAINITKIIGPSLLEKWYGATPVLHLVPKQGKELELCQTLKQNEMNGVGYRIWMKEQMRLKYHYTNSRRIADYVLVAEPGYVFEDLVANLQQWNATGNLTREFGVHGYDNQDKSMSGIFLAKGPVFREGYEFAPIETVDIVPLISKILGIPQPQNNGSFSRVEEMVRSQLLPAILTTYATEENA